jgi:hypothetical protein
MDAVYISRSGDNEELRYSIRSIVTNLKHDNIWVVGQKPSWYTGNFISVPDKRLKYLNARENLKAIINDNRISEDFILMNDDFYVMKPVDTVEYFYSGSLESKALELESVSAHSAYTRMLYSTLDRLDQQGIKGSLSYELHVPFIMNKQKLQPIIKQKTTLWRSMYGNTYNVGGKQMDDVKVYIKTSRKKSFDWENNLDTYLSSQDESFELLKTKLLNTRFPNKTIYEA